MKPNIGDVSQSSRFRSAILCFGLLVGFAVIVSRLFYLQVIQANEGALQAWNQHHKSIVVESNRGVIVDRNGSALALNVEVPSVTADPMSIEDRGKVAEKLSRALDVPKSQLMKELGKKQDFVWLKRKLDESSAKAVQQLSLPGVDILMEPRRFYPKTTLLANLLGFAGIDSQGLEGIELQYESYLQGGKSLVVFQRDARGRMINPVGSRKLRASEGHRITLTIDEVIQYIAEQELDAAIQRTQAKGGTVLVMDPATGAMLAWAIRPTFDPNKISAGSPDLWRNRAVTDVYEPGSTFKVVVAASALEEGVVEPDTLIYGGDGGMSIAGTTVHDIGKSGWITFSEVLRHSSNVGMVKAAISLGDKRLYKYLRAFGFGEKTEIDLPGESAGILRDPSKWSSRSLASLSMGQEVGVTPIQLLTAVSAVANGGYLLKPYVVSEVWNAQGERVLKREVEAKRRPISDETAQVLTGLLQEVVAQGTGKRAGLAEYAVAGKTGTAQVFDQKAKAYSSTKVIGSFVGFVPAEAPRLAILVVIDEPKTEGWGGVVAAPVFRKVSEQVLRHMRIAPKNGGLMKVAAIS